jgi:hypothetical protein
VKRGALSILAVTVAAAVVTANAGRPASRAGAVRAGGVNTAPSMRPWRYAGADTDSWWCKRDACNGVSNGTEFVDRELPLAAELGARTLRIELPWALIEPRRGRFDWARFDYIVRAARRLKVTLQPVIVYTPAWAGKAANSPPPPRPSRSSPAPWPVDIAVVFATTSSGTSPISRATGPARCSNTSSES